MHYDLVCIGHGWRSLDCGELGQLLLKGSAALHCSPVGLGFPHVYSEALARDRVDQEQGVMKAIQSLVCRIDGIPKDSNRDIDIVRLDLAYHGYCVLGRAPRATVGCRRNVGSNGLG